MYVGCSLSGTITPGRNLVGRVFDYNGNDEAAVEGICNDLRRHKVRIKRRVILLSKVPKIEVDDIDLTIDWRAAESIRGLLKAYAVYGRFSYGLYLYTAICLVHRLDDVKQSFANYDLFISEMNVDKNVPAIATVFALYKHFMRTNCTSILEHGVVDENLYFNYDVNKYLEFMDLFAYVSLEQV